MDALESVNFKTDSTVSIIRSLQEDNRIEYIHLDSLSYFQESIEADVSTLRILSINENRYKLGSRRKIKLNKLDCIFFRKDPPVDSYYTTLCHLFLKLQKQNVLVLNSPKSLLEFNEKMLGYDLSDPKPPTLLSNSLSEIKKFLKLNEDIVMKPVNLMAGQGIIRIKNTDKNNIEQIRRFLEKYKVAVSQKYLKQIKSGDTRIIIYDGIIEENVLVRYPQKGDFRANIACGGSYKIKPINKKFSPVLNKVASFLKYHDIFFAGVDMIGKYITEINITSPTGVQQISGGLSKKIANSLVKKIQYHYEYTK